MATIVAKDNEYGSVGQALDFAGRFSRLSGLNVNPVGRISSWILLGEADPEDAELELETEAPDVASLYDELNLLSVHRQGDPLTGTTVDVEEGGDVYVAFEMTEPEAGYAISAMIFPVADREKNPEHPLDAEAFANRQSVQVEVHAPDGTVSHHQTTVHQMLDEAVTEADYFPEILDQTRGDLHGFAGAVLTWNQVADAVSMREIRGRTTQWLRDSIAAMDKVANTVTSDTGVRAVLSSWITGSTGTPMSEGVNLLNRTLGTAGRFRNELERELDSRSVEPVGM